MEYGGTHRVARIGGDAAAFEPRHVGVPKGIFGQTSERGHVDRTCVDSWTPFQDATSLLTLEHMV